MLSYVQDGLAPGDDPHQAQYLLGELGLSGEEDRRSCRAVKRAARRCAVLALPPTSCCSTSRPTISTCRPSSGSSASSTSAALGVGALISHDRRFLGNLSRATIWLDRGTTRRLELGFGSFEAWRDEVLAQEELDQHKLDRKIEAEQHWLRYGVTARRKRNVRRLAALQDLPGQSPPSRRRPRRRSAPPRPSSRARW